jgi:hypothetical protein
MTRQARALIAIGAGSWFSWYPVIASRGLLPWWAPLPFIALLAASTTSLFPQRRFAIVTDVSVCTFLGDYSGYFIWQPLDGVSASYTPLVVAGVTIAVLLVALVASLVIRMFAPFGGMRPRSLWILLIFSLTFELAVVAATPLALSYRIAQNDRIAASRFVALKQSVEKTVADGLSVCDGATLQRRYSGPPFSTKDWNYITHNAVLESGYFFTVHCQPEDGYAIQAEPARENIDGTRSFCTDESRTIGCRLEWNRSRYQCVPCSR